MFLVLCMAPSSNCVHRYVSSFDIELVAPNLLHLSMTLHQGFLSVCSVDSVAELSAT